MTTDGIGGIQGHYGGPVRPPGAAEAPRQTEEERQARIATDEQDAAERREDRLTERRQVEERAQYGGAPDPTGTAGSSLDLFA